MKAITLFFGLIILMNPEFIYIFDLIPDFIGYILIAHALYRVSFLDHKLYEARRSAVKLIWLCLIKFFISFIAPTFSDMNLLLTVFSVTLIELIMVIPFVQKLFGGLDYIVSRHGSEKTLKKSKGTLVCLYIFITARELLSLLAPAVSLFDPIYSGDYKYYYIDFQNLKRGADAAVFLIVLLLSVIAVVMTAKYLFAIRRDKLLNEEINRLYGEDILSDANFIKKVELSRLFTLFAAGGVFLANFYIDGINILPTFIGYVIIFIAAVKAPLFRIPLVLLSLFGFVVEVFTFATRVLYVFNEKDIEKFTSPLEIMLGLLSFVISSIVLAIIAYSIYTHAIKYGQIQLLKEFICFTIFSILVSLCAFISYAFPQYNEYTNMPSLAITFFYLFYLFSFTSKSKSWIGKVLS